VIWEGAREVDPEPEDLLACRRLDVPDVRAAGSTTTAPRKGRRSGRSHDVAITIRLLVPGADTCRDRHVRRAGSVAGHRGEGLTLNAGRHP
jgi:hypothetical protein